MNQSNSEEIIKKKEEQKKNVLSLNSTGYITNLILFVFSSVFLIIMTIVLNYMIINKK